MGRVPVVFTFNKQVVLAAAVAIKSLLDSADGSDYDIHILHPDLSAANQKAFLELDPGITFHHVDKSRFKGFATTGSWSEIVYYRLLIPEILPQYDKVVYSDKDVFFKKDLGEVFDADLTGFEWAGVRAEVNGPDAVGHQYFPENKKDYIFWSGFMVINCAKWRQDNVVGRCLENARVFKNRLRFFDLDLVNITCDNIKPVPFDYCVLESILELGKDARDYEFLKKVYTDEELACEPAIIHYAGALGKPWRRKNPPEYYKQCTCNIPKKLRRYTFRDLRKMWLG